MRPRRLTPLALAAALACEDGPAAPAGAAGRPVVAGPGLATDFDAYVARTVRRGLGYRERAFTLVASYTNADADTVYLARCYPNSPGPMYGVELEDGRRGESWGAAYNSAWACVGHNRQIAVAPGAVRVDTLRLAGPNAWDGRTGEALGTMAGPMRLVYHPQRCRGDGACALPPARSNVFDVRTD